MKLKADQIATARVAVDFQCFKSGRCCFHAFKPVDLECPNRSIQAHIQVEFVTYGISFGNVTNPERRFLNIGMRIFEHVTVSVPHTLKS